MARSKSKPTAKTHKPAATKTTRLYTVEVFLIFGPTEKLPKKSQRVTRTIQIRGDQTLEDLHLVIFDAFDRYDNEHLYEFQFGEWRATRGAPRYVHPDALGEYDSDEGVAGVADETTIESLGLSVGDVFRYWFDFGDDWWHQITVKAIDENAPDGEYPKVVDRVGKSPPQYPGDEDEDDDDE